MPDAGTVPLLFAGPSTWGLSVHACQGVTSLPPVRRGDVARAVGSAEPGVMIVCDGVFQVAPAVSHAELCGAIDAGWQVWGVSSLGAIRAWELRHEGMHGFGEVYAMFERFEDFTDDEMCLLHFPEPPWFPVTEALVNVRHALDADGAALGIAPAHAQAVVDALRAMWFGDRTAARVRSLLLQVCDIAPEVADALLARIRRRPVKTTDLERLLALRPWIAPGDPARTP